MAKYLDLEGLKKVWNRLKTKHIKITDSMVTVGAASGAGPGYLKINLKSVAPQLYSGMILNFMFNITNTQYLFEVPIEISFNGTKYYRIKLTSGGSDFIFSPAYKNRILNFMYIDNSGTKEIIVISGMVDDANIYIE